jgi:hypothetical protein
VRPAFIGAGLPQVGVRDYHRRTPPRGKTVSDRRAASGRPDAELAKAPVSGAESWAMGLPEAFMLGHVQQHHVQLSAMADLKASIVITAASIVLSVAVGFSVQDIRPSLLVLSGFMAVALVMAVLAALPKVRPQHRIGPELPKGFNLLFFGHFVSLDLERYVAEVMPLLRDNTKLAEAQITDIYEMGVYLERDKYRFLRYAFVTFVAGLLTAGVVEIIDLVV